MHIVVNTVIKITKEQLADLPHVEYPGTISVIDTPEGAVRAMDDIVRHKVVGFDTETKPSFRKGQLNKVSLIQISTGDHCYLFRLNKIGFMPLLQKFMEDEALTKVGLSLKDDFMVLNRLAPFHPAGFIDLQTTVRSYDIADMSLQKVYAILFGARISKSQRLTNWEAPELTVPQQIYASIDAWACLRIWRHLCDGRFNPAESAYRVELSDESPKEET